MLRGVQVTTVLTLLASAGLWAARTEPRAGATDAAHADGAAAADADADNDEDADNNYEDDGENAYAPPFMVILIHENGGVDCSGSLVSPTAVLTSRWCATWPTLVILVRAAAAQCSGCTVPVSSVVLSGKVDAPKSAGADIAMVLLETPLGAAARWRPILLGTSLRECEGTSRTCHVVRTLPPAPAPVRRSTTRLRVFNIKHAPGRGKDCAASARNWNAIKDRAVCFIKPILCETEWGSGVVCNGKLCGVVSRSARLGQAAPWDAPREQGRECGDVHAAMSVPRWSSFFNCALSQRACSSVQCGNICHKISLQETVPNESQSISAELENTNASLSDQKSGEMGDANGHEPRKNVPLKSSTKVGGQYEDRSNDRHEPNEKVNHEVKNGSVDQHEPDEKVNDEDKNRSDDQHEPNEKVNHEDKNESVDQLEPDEKVNNEDKNRSDDQHEPNEKLNNEDKNRSDDQHEPDEKVNNEEGEERSTHLTYPSPMPPAHSATRTRSYKEVSPSTLDAETEAERSVMKGAGAAREGGLGDFDMNRAEFRAGEYDDDYAEQPPAAAPSSAPTSRYLSAPPQGRRTMAYVHSPPRKTTVPRVRPQPPQTPKHTTISYHTAPVKQKHTAPVKQKHTAPVKQKHTAPPSYHTLSTYAERAKSYTQISETPVPKQHASQVKSHQRAHTEIGTQPEYIVYTAAFDHDPVHYQLENDQSGQTQSRLQTFAYASDEVREPSHHHHHYRPQYLTYTPNAVRQALRTGDTNTEFDDQGMEKNTANLFSFDVFFKLLCIIVFCLVL